MTNAQNPTITRDEALDILSAREGTPRDEIHHLPDEAIIAAAQAREGQPCADCRHIVVWDEDVQDWRHVDTPTTCFLARADER